MIRAVCSGSFDPVTNGHIDIFERASLMFDELIICVFHNVHKQGFFPVEQRADLIREAVLKKRLTVLRELLSPPAHRIFSRRSCPPSPILDWNHF